MPTDQALSLCPQTKLSDELNHDKAKVAVNQMARQDEAVQKIKGKKKAKVKATIKEEATKAEQAMSAEDAAPAKATKEDAAVRTWPGLTSDSAPSWPG